MKESKDYLLLDLNSEENDEYDNEVDTSLTHRRHSKKVSAKEKESMQAIESLDFSEIDNILLRKYTNQLKRSEKIMKSLGKWVICTLIGIIVGIVVYCLKKSVDELQELKFHSIEKCPLASSSGLPESFLYTYTELIPFCIMGIIGGLLGALYVYMNVRINYYRKVYLGNRPLYRLAEVAIIVLLTSVICFFPAMVVNCRAIPNIVQSSTDVCDVAEESPTVQFFCPKDFYNQLASLTFTTSENALKLLYSRDSNIFTAGTLFGFTVMFFLLCVVTSGVYVASGIFIPMMLIGGAWGRLFGKFIDAYILRVDPSLYALIGSAAMMGGSLRMTISLVVIIVELTEGTQYLLPVILVVMISKWTGDAFNESIYEHLIELKHIPYLPSKPSRYMSKLTVSDAMATNVITLPEVVSVRQVLEVLHNSPHNGFPVVLLPHLHESDNSTNNNNNNNNNNNKSNNDSYQSSSGNSSPFLPNSPDSFRSSLNSDYSVRDGSATFRQSTNKLKEVQLFQSQKEGKVLCGLILRSQLLILIKHRIFIEAGSAQADMNFLQDVDLPIDHRLFVTELASKLPTIQQLSNNLTPQQMDMEIDLRPYMNFAVVSIKNYSSLSEAYKLFRLVGLRHVVVVNVFNQIVGSVTS
ncbi:chloride channel protein [Heterostelium album PN500]|uniref:Chloride channel protein n=1 Tax=Heterostelium pallidum (strain ATCC 26659 / Pp 5 / PN500) TaxID=670386 RepID=D3BP98_HETP5|nr:chloride channel protein [Heterostelium album PN500]EFA77108.1 chloride channel protein [Heterostelium album PN500]|eukprot:XP_020429237.1 chloride channel protein [Heterostelium album PN500]